MPLPFRRFYIERDWRYGRYHITAYITADSGQSMAKVDQAAKSFIESAIQEKIEREDANGPAIQK